jgi:hypothetical protein
MVDGSSHTHNFRALCGACSFSLVACLCVVAVVTACDESFDPIQPSDLSFSVFGYLDASADTQWIRVMPIRPLKVTSEDPLGITVTLENLGTGRTIELRDSLFRFSSSSDSALGSEGAYVHNFWTQEHVEPGASYRFSVRQEGEEPSEAVVEIPLDFEVEVGIRQGRASYLVDSLLVTGVKQLPFVTAIAHFYDECGAGQVQTPYKKSSADDEAHLMVIEKPVVTERAGCGPFVVANWELWIMGSEVAWPAAGYSPGAIGGSGQTSNVTNAVGFLGGALTKLIPYEYCQIVGDVAPVPAYCGLRYNSETATVTGTVSETRCGDGPVDSATVRLTEMDRDPARIRPVLTDQAGKFVIGALEPGIPHFLWARAPQIPVDSVFDLRRFRYVYTAWDDVYTIPTDTLTFIPGEQLAYDIHLERLTPCTEPPPRPR